MFKINLKKILTLGIILASFMSTSIFALAQNQGVLDKKVSQATESSPYRSQVTGFDDNISSRNDVVSDQQHSIFKNIQIGPMVGIGIINGPSIGIEAKVFHFFGFGINYSSYSFSRGISMSSSSASANYNITDIGLKYRQLEAKLVYYPFGKSFYLAAAFGSRKMTFTSSGTVSTKISAFPETISAPIHADFALQSTYIAPTVGWLWNWEGPTGGLAIGTDFGIQFSTANELQVNSSVDGQYSPYTGDILSGADYQDYENKIKTDLVNSVKNTPLPFWNIIKVGWLF